MGQCGMGMRQCGIGMRQIVWNGNETQMAE